MGSGMLYTCEKCGSSHSLALGIGFSFPRVCQQIMDDIRWGKFGEEWKTLVEANALVAVDAELRLYQCACGHWEVEYGLSLFEPKDCEVVLAEESGENAAEWGRAPCVMGPGLERDYKLLKEWVHRCPKCDAAMEAVDGGECFPGELTCPDCGGAMHGGIPIRWD